MNTVNIGVMGCGAIVQGVHLNVLQGITNARIIALAEPDAVRLQQGCARCPSAKGYAAWREMLADERIDAVVVALPTGMHAEAAVAAFEAGKHVYLEKPLAITGEQGGRVVDAWRKSGRVGMMGFNHRFNPLYSEIKRQVLAGRVGEVLCARTVFSTHSANLPQWKKSRAEGGGVLLDLGSHHIDLMRSIFGEVVSVFARINSVANEADTATISMRMKGGVLVESFFSLASVEQDQIEIHGRGGRLWAHRYQSSQVIFEPVGMPPSAVSRAIGSVRRIPLELKRMARRGREDSYGLALGQFITAVINGNAVSPDLLDGLKSLDVIEAAEESARRRCEVEVRPA